MGSFHATQRFNIFRIINKWSRRTIIWDNYIINPSNLDLNDIGRLILHPPVLLTIVMMLHDFSKYEEINVVCRPYWCRSYWCPWGRVCTTLIYPLTQLRLKNKQSPSKLQCRRDSQEWQIDGWNAIQDQSCFKVYQQHRRAGCTSTYRLPKLWQVYIPALRQPSNYIYVKGRRFPNRNTLLYGWQFPSARRREPVWVCTKPLLCNIGRKHQSGFISIHQKKFISPSFQPL